MPWKVSDVMEQRFQLIEHWRKGEECIADLARRFQISRRTIYKWLERYQLEGFAGLEDRSRAPLVQASQTAAEIEQWIVDARQARPRWGPKKLRNLLLRRKPEIAWPAESTIGLILHRHGLTQPQRKRRRTPPWSQPLAHARQPNDVWAIDFKGGFACQDGSWCEPLTVTDAATRYLLCCRQLPNHETATVEQQLRELFYRHGLPERIRSDNGTPFASTGVGGLSRLSVWWIKLGILPERIAAGEPQQNGRHERMHRTLEEEVGRPAASNLAEQQRRLEEFVEDYNQQRPHEALNGATPGERYRASERAYPERIGEMEYEAGVWARRADKDGKIRWKQARCRVGMALAHEVVGLEEVNDGLYRVRFGPVILGYLDERAGYSQTARKLTASWPALQPPSGRLARRPTGAEDQKDGRKV